jgi:hypothetical protein
MVSHGSSGSGRAVVRWVISLVARTSSRPRPHGVSAAKGVQHGSLFWNTRLQSSVPNGGGRFGVRALVG